VDNLVWVQELIEALDLEALGTVLDAQLRAYVDRGSPADERLLAERCAFEHEVRRYRARAQERGYAKIKCLGRRGIFRKTGAPMIAIASR